MSREVPKNIWELNMGDMPMPKGITFDEMYAMYDAIKHMEDKDYAAEQIKFYEGLWRKTLPSYKDAIAHKDTDPERYETLSSTMKLIKEGIIMFRKQLTE